MIERNSYIQGEKLRTPALSESCRTGATSPNKRPTSMSIQSDRWITRMARDHGMIEPFESSQVRSGVISYGVSSYGYDMRVAPEFRIFSNVMNSIVDPKSFDPKCFVEFEGDVCIVPPNSFALARSVE